jgi:hypothetical protein
VITRLIWGPERDWNSAANVALIEHLLGEGDGPIPPPPRSAAVKLTNAG